MQLRSWVIAALLAMTAPYVSEVRAADPRIGKLVRYDAGDYTIYTSRSASQARDFIGDLAKFRVALEKAAGETRDAQRAVPDEHRDRERERLREVLSAAGKRRGVFSAGAGSPTTWRSTATRVSKRSRSSSTNTRTTISRSQFAGEYPPWFNEGIAELMGT